MAEAVCAVCGNEIDPGVGQCPFCGAERAATAVSGGGPAHREVNLERGLPPVAQALDRLDKEIALAALLGIRVLTLIHGYGSTGKGGGIRTETRRYLQRQKDKRQIRDFITGEQFSIFDEATRAAFLVCDDLRRDSDLERSNNGITIVIL